MVKLMSVASCAPRPKCYRRVASADGGRKPEAGRFSGLSRRANRPVVLRLVGGL